MKDLQE
jgi:IQ and AAA domain-containing protein